MASNVAYQVLLDQGLADMVYLIQIPYIELIYKYYNLSKPFYDETAAVLMVKCHESFSVARLISFHFF